MTIEEFGIELSKVGIPVAYFSYQKDNIPKYPFIIYYDEEPNIIAADNIVYYQTIPIVIQLYTKRRDEELEERIRAVLDKNGLFYFSKADFGSDKRNQKVHLVTYEVQIN